MLKAVDMVAAQFQWHVGPEGIVAKPEQFEELGIPVYTAPADCVGKDNSAGGGDGVRHTVFSRWILSIRKLEELAQIFNVQDRAQVVADLKAREEAARKKVSSVEGKLSAVVRFSSAELDIDPYVAGKNGAPAYILKTLGIDNIIDSEEEWPTVGWEQSPKPIRR